MSTNNQRSRSYRQLDACIKKIKNVFIQTKKQSIAFTDLYRLYSQYNDKSDLNTDRKSCSNVKLSKWIKSLHQHFIVVGNDKFILKRRPPASSTPQEKGSSPSSSIQNSPLNKRPRRSSLRKSAPNPKSPGSPSTTNRHTFKNTRTKMDPFVDLEVDFEDSLENKTFSISQSALKDVSLRSFQEQPRTITDKLQNLHDADIDGNHLEVASSPIVETAKPLSAKKTRDELEFQNYRNKIAGFWYRLKTKFENIAYIPLAEVIEIFQSHFEESVVNMIELPNNISEKNTYDPASLSMISWLNSEEKKVPVVLEEVGHGECYIRAAQTCLNPFSLADMNLREYETPNYLSLHQKRKYIFFRRVETLVEKYSADDIDKADVCSLLLRMYHTIYCHKASLPGESDLNERFRVLCKNSKAYEAEATAEVVELLDLFRVPNIGWNEISDEEFKKLKVVHNEQTLALLFPNVAGAGRLKLSHLDILNVVMNLNVPVVINNAHRFIHL